MSEPSPVAPAYYVSAAKGWRRDVMALLHPPYTAWHLSYVLIGAGLAPVLKPANLIATIAAFFLAVGISAHSLDELRGRPLQTSVPSPVLWTAALGGLVGAVALGVAGVVVVGAGLVPFIVAGVLFVFAYNLELMGGRLHGDLWFALSWGAFPVLTAYFAQTATVSLGAAAAAGAAFALSYGQRALSTRARNVRRRARSVTGLITFGDGSQETVDGETLLRPLEVGLRSFAWGVVLLGLGLVAAKLL